jgi:hypothetical protein
MPTASISAPATTETGTCSARARLVHTGRVETERWTIPQFQQDKRWLLVIPDLDECLVDREPTRSVARTRRPANQTLHRLNASTIAVVTAWFGAETRKRANKLDAPTRTSRNPKA